MNSSSIVIAFMLAGVLSVVIHNAVVGPMVIRPAEIINQVAVSSNNVGAIKRTEIINSR